MFLADLTLRAESTVGAAMFVQCLFNVCPVLASTLGTKRTSESDYQNC